MSFSIFGHSFGNVATAPGPTAPPPVKESFGEKMGDMWSHLKDTIGLGGINSAAKTAFLKFDTNQSKGLEAPEFGIIGQVMGQGFGAAVKGNKADISLGEFKTFVKRSFADEFKSMDGDHNGMLAGGELQGLAQRFPYVAMGTWDSSNRGFVTERQYMQTRANQLATA